METGHGGSPAARRAADGCIQPASAKPGGAENRRRSGNTDWNPSELPDRLFTLSFQADGAEKTRSQPAAFFTSATIFASSAAVSSLIANATGHIEPSSSLAESLKPKVEYRALNFCAPWKKHTTLPSRA